MADIIRINENTWSIEDGMVRFFVLEGDESALMLDSGMTTGGSIAKELAQSIVGTDKPLLLMNTHGDRDHVAGNNAFDSCYMNKAEEDNYRMAGGTTKINYVEDKDVIDLGNRELEIILIPGHTPGSIAIYDRNSRSLFAGDSVQNSDIFMFGPKRNIGNYIMSLEKLLKMSDKFDTIYGSHGSLTVPVDQIECLLDYVTTIRDSYVPGIVVDMWGNKILLHKFPKAGFFVELPVDRAVSTEVMRKSDAWTISNLTSSKELMSRAGTSIVVAATSIGLISSPVAIVCGKGNNAGDGFVVANILKSKDIQCEIYLLCPDSFSDDGKYYFDECVANGISYKTFTSDTDLNGYSTIVDCIFGTGFRGVPEGIFADAINAINNSSAKVISADINSGINGDTGEGTIYVKSDLTVSIGSYKTGHFKGVSLEAMKAISNCDIGIVIGEYENE